VDIVIFVGIGLVMGLFGGLLGIGGALVMVPALVLFFGENQHLYQASAMTCTFFVAIAASVVHRKAKILVPGALRQMIPGAIVGVLVGVALSNIRYFAGGNSYLLARFFGAFLLYVAGYNIWGLYRPIAENSDGEPNGLYKTPKGKVYSGVIGLITGIASGFLGIGAGTVVTPLMQFCLGFPLKRAMSNAAAIILSISWIGAIYKTATLPPHGVSIAQSLHIAAWVIPSAILGGYWGGHLMHRLPRLWVQLLFIAVCVLSAIKLLTVQPSAG
jgi:hypothetical protein